MVSESEGEVFNSKIDPCEFVGREMINLVLHKKCANWGSGRCAKQGKLTVNRQCVCMFKL